MRIALFTEAYLPQVGGIISNISILVDQLASLGHETLVVTADLNARDFHIDEGVLKCPAKQARTPYGFCIESSGSAAFFKLLEKFKPDVLHLHTVSPIGQAAIKFANRYDLPIVFTIHDYFEQHLHYLCSRVAEPVTRMKCRGQFKDFVDNADVITAASKKAEEFLKDCHLRRNLTIIPNQTDCSRFDYHKVPSSKIQQLRRSLNLPLEKTLAVFAGRLTIDKGVEILLEQWANRIKREDHLHLLILGDGPEAEPLSVWAHELRISNQVSFLGAIPHEKMPEYYAVSNVFVSASSNDMMSMAALEAAACGVPTLLKHDQYNASQIKEGVSGFSYHTEKEFADYLRRFAALDEEGKRLLRKVVRSSIQATPSLALAQSMLGAYREAQQQHFYTPDEEE